MDKQRRVMRVSLPEPVAGTAADEQIHIVDASLRGIRISHRTLFPPRGKLPITFEFDGKEVGVTGTIRWTKLQPFERSVYQSGVEIVSMNNDAEIALRGLVQNQVERALDEQKANAKGIPPLAGQSIQSRQAKLYARHELINGVWRKSVTANAEQPLDGFTISTTERKYEVDLLRAAYEMADPQMRRFIQKVAGLTISNREGIPARRFTP